MPAYKKENLEEQKLFEAFKNVNMSEVSKLLSEGRVYINGRYEDERNPLAIATNLGNKEMVEFLIGYGADNVAKKIVDAKINGLIRAEYLILSNGVNGVLVMKAIRHYILLHGTGLRMQYKFLKEEVQMLILKMNMETLLYIVLLAATIKI